MRVCVSDAQTVCAATNGDESFRWPWPDPRQRTFAFVAEHDGGGHAPVHLPNVFRVGSQVRRDNLHTICLSRITSLHRHQVGQCSHAFTSGSTQAGGPCAGSMLSMAMIEEHHLSCASAVCMMSRFRCDLCYSVRSQVRGSGEPGIPLQRADRYTADILME